MSPNMNHTFLNSFWKSTAIQFTPPLSASITVIPVFYGFLLKSALQTDSKVPVSGLKNIWKVSLKASPTIGCVIGVQIFAQNFIENILGHTQVHKNHSPFSVMIMSSLTVGCVSVIPLAIFNGQTLGQSALKTIQQLSIKQTTAITIRETSFLFSLRISKPIGELMKQKMGDNQLIDCSSLFVTGAIGSLIGHPADTALTRLQKGMTPLKSVKQSMQGSITKAMTLGIFNLLYQKTKDYLDSTIEKI